MTSGALVQVDRPPATRGFDGAAVPKERFDPEPPWTPEERRIHVQGRSEPHRLQAEIFCCHRTYEVKHSHFLFVIYCEV